MIKMIMFVHCDGWEDGGYKNTLYFLTQQYAEDWLAKHPHCELISLTRVFEEEFAEDYIGSL